MKKTISKITDKNFNTLESLYTSKGKINSKVICKKNFKNLKIYKYVFDKTHELDVFPKITFSQRVIYLHDKMKLSYCPKCGKPKIGFPSQQKYFSLCKHHNVSKEGLTKIKTKFEKIHVDFIDAIENNKHLFLSNQNFNAILQKINPKNNINYNYLLTKKLFCFYHDLVIKTIELIPFNHEKFEFGKRIFFVKNNITKIPVCKYCGINSCSYINSQIGFSENCKNCSNDKYRETASKKYISLYFNKIDTNKYQIISFPKMLNKQPLVILCKKCKKISEIWLKNGKIRNIKDIKLCHYCESNSSKQETIIKEFIEKLGFTVLHKNGTRKIIPPKELDIYVPSKKLAIEYDGLYWHSIDTKNKTYHLDKTIACEEKGIQLIHIFENEWMYKQDIVKSRLKNLLGIYDKTVFARKCEVKEVDSKTSKAFQEDNHIQGAVNAKVNVGLYYDNELISLMTFGKTRFSKKYEWEMLRFCNKLGYHIPGAAGKLLKYFEKTYNPKSLVSYADRRWSTGKLYKALGFTLDHISAPNYWYWRNKYMLESRTKYQKHKLNKLLEKFDSTKSEFQNMIDNGFNRIFDCGNLVFIKTYV